MEKNRPSTHGRTAKKEEMEMDWAHVAETTKQHHQTGIAVEPPRSPRKGKA